MAGADDFTKSPVICDACLAQDYSTNASIGVELRSGMSIGLLAALIAGALITISHKNEALAHFRFLPPFARGLVSVFIVSVLIAIPCMLLAWLAIHMLFSLGEWRARNERRIELDESAGTDAERFHWLAEWAALTGHDKFRARMLRQAEALGYHDRSRDVHR